MPKSTLPRTPTAPTRAQRISDDMPSKPLFSVSETTEFIPASATKIRELAYAGILDYVKAGRKMLIVKASIVDWIEKYASGSDAA